MKKFCRSTAYDYVGHNEKILQKPKDSQLTRKFNTYYYQNSYLFRDNLI